MRAMVDEALYLAGLYCQDGRTRFVEEVSNGYSISSSGQWRVMDMPHMEIPCVSVLNTETKFTYTITHHQILQGLRGIV